MKPFFINPQTATRFYQRAFLIYINQFALLAAKGNGAGEAHEGAMDIVNGLSLSAQDKRGFQELVVIFSDGGEVSTTFILNSEPVRATVRWTFGDKYPTAV